MLKGDNLNLFSIRDLRIENKPYLYTMKQHNGMRPHDIVVLLKIIALGKQPWLNKDLAGTLFISQSEISESLNRSQIAGLLDPSKRKVFKSALLDFLQHGFKYVYPAQPGAIQKGLPTAHSAPVLNKLFTSEEIFVWPYENGQVRGQVIQPLYPGVPKTVLNDHVLYDLLAICDVLRIGRTREIKTAITIMESIFNHEQANQYIAG